MNAVYHHFERNLADIIRAGQRSGANLVVSTVAVNLKDCAPFASAHQPGLSGPDQAKWEQLYQFGIKAQAANKAQEAAEQFQAAAQIDDHFADLRFRQGECALALGKILEAQRQFQAACDLDTLRFRCDSRLNDLIRQAASGRESKRILFADAQRTFADHSPDGLPGEDLFYEHVHLNFDGNYFLARTIGAKIEELLPEWVAARSGTNRPWPSASDCARRLAWTDWNRQEVLSDVFARLNDPPFTGQLNHDAQMQRLIAQMEKMAPARQPAGISEARQVCEEALAVAPDDPALYGQLATLKRMAGDFTGASAAARRELELLPSDSEGWSELGIILAQQQQLEEASGAFRRAFQLNPLDMGSRLNLAQVQAALGRREEAVREYRRVLAVRPDSVPVLLSLGQVLEQMGRKAEAENCYQKALTTRTHNSPVELARFCRSRGWFEAAVTNYNEALKLDPSDAILHVEAGQALAALGRYAEAAPHSAEALRLAPELAESHLLQGTLLWQQGRAAEAGEQFLEALRLRPERLDARMNLGIVLMTQGRSAEALAQFEAVLQRSPTNEAALQYIKRLRAKPGSGPSP
jgi:tetratricopeptide (TPR) repeat protein